MSLGSGFSIFDLFCEDCFVFFDHVLQPGWETSEARDIFISFQVFKVCDADFTFLSLFVVVLLLFFLVGVLLVSLLHGLCLSLGVVVGDVVDHVVVALVVGGGSLEESLVALNVQGPLWGGPS